MPTVNLAKAVKTITRTEEEEFYRKKAKLFGLAYVDLVYHPLSPKILNLVPEKTAQEWRTVPYLFAKDQLRLATDSPENLLPIKKALLTLPTLHSLELSFAVASPASLSFALSLYAKFAAAKARETKAKKPALPPIRDYDELLKNLPKISLTSLLDFLFEQALALDASDIHFEPQENNLRIRFRLDGVLVDQVNLPSEWQVKIANRLKFLAKLKLDIKDKPQDGRLGLKINQQEVDVRLAILPASFGEALEMRLLPKNRRFLTLENLGFNTKALQLINEAIAKPHGLILVTGPTGSGKTTTLYALLDKLNQPERKIITLEDPIEYQIKGVDQSQVEMSKGYDFASALRAALRQDPDILMIGEIRDKETAEVALHAALTGHLVLATLHTNNASAALPRLLDMGVEPYLLSGTILVVLAQRLVRKVHPQCLGQGCALDAGSGLKGRTAILEVLKITPDFEALIQRQASVFEYERLAKKLGLLTMREDGLEKVRQGLTTRAEVERVTAD